MASPTATQKLLDASKRGQEIVADPDGLRVDCLLVVHSPRKETDPAPWVHRGAHGRQRRFRASQCFARLALPLPVGTVVQHVQSGLRGLYGGPPECGVAGFVRVEFHPSRGKPYILDVSRNLLRLAED